MAVYDDNQQKNAVALLAFSEEERITACLELFHTENDYVLFAHNYHMALTGQGLLP